MRTPARKLAATPTPFGQTPLYQIPEENRDQKFDVPQEIEGLPELKPEDHQYFGKLLKEVRAGSLCPLATCRERVVRSYGTSTSRLSEDLCWLPCAAFTVHLQQARGCVASEQHLQACLMQARARLELLLRLLLALATHAMPRMLQAGLELHGLRRWRTRS